MKTISANTNAQPSRSGQRGVTLIELLVAMVLGLVVIGVVLSNYLTSSIGKNSSSALQQMTEDATVALNVIRKNISTAGQSDAIGVVAGGFQRNPIGLRIFGCETGFVNPLLPVDNLVCDAAGSEAIAVAYQADAVNSATLADNVTPRDCVGNGIPPTLPGAGAAYFVASPKLFINNNELMCQGNGAGAQPLVSNISRLWIRYGVAAPLPAVPDTPQTYPAPPVKFISAANVTAAEWPRVMAVRVCVEVQSTDEVLDAATPYFGCNAIEAAAADFEPKAVNPALIVPADRRMHRAFSTTVMLQNIR